MARLHLTPLATGPHPIASGLSTYTPLVLETDFDYLTAWAIACQRDDLEGEREEAEAAESIDVLGDVTDPGSLRMPDFDPPTDDESSDDEHLPLLPPQTQPTAPLNSSEPLESDDADDWGFTNIVHPSAQPSSATTTDSEAEPVVQQGLKRRRGEGAKKRNRDRKDRKKKRELEKRREEGALPVHGEQYVQRYLHPDVVERDFDVIKYKAVKGGDTGKNEPKGAKKKCVASLEEGRKENYGLFNWDGVYV